jgi:prepilin-type N-terminal cleavage/methylation domain-containing protein
MRNRPRPGHRRGFTLVEMACAVVLTGMLGVLLASTWAAFGVPAVESYRRGRLAREAIMAAASLRADLGGSLPVPVGRLGKVADLGFVGWRTTDGTDLEICFDNAPTDGIASYDLTDYRVVYWVADGTLHRWDQATSTTTVVAGDVTAMSVDDDPDGTGQRLRVDLSFRHRDVTRTHTFIASKP